MFGRGFNSCLEAAFTQNIQNIQNIQESAKIGCDYQNSIETNADE